MKKDRKPKIPRTPRDQLSPAQKVLYDAGAVELEIPEEQRGTVRLRLRHRPRP